MAASPTACTWRWTGWTARCSSARTPSPGWRACTASWCPAASASAAPRARSRPSSSRASTGCPFFGICFGMQMAVIEAARNLAGLPNASSTEFGPCEEPVVGLLTEWARGNEVERRVAGGDLGGTMRLGAFPAVLAADSLVSRNLRRRHRDQASGTAIASRSTSITGTSWRRRGCASPACRQTESCRRSWNCPAIPGSSACSTIPS